MKRPVNYRGTLIALAGLVILAMAAGDCAGTVSVWNECRESGRSILYCQQVVAR